MKQARFELFDWVLVALMIVIFGYIIAYDCNRNTTPNTEPVTVRAK